MSGSMSAFHPFRTLAGICRIEPSEETAAGLVSAGRQPALSDWRGWVTERQLGWGFLEFARASEQLVDHARVRQR